MNSLWLFSLQKLSFPDGKNGCFINHYQSGPFLQVLQGYPASVTIFSMLQGKSSIKSPMFYTLFGIAVLVCASKAITK